MNFEKAVKDRLDGRTQVWLADKTGMSREFLNALLKGKKKWHIDKLILVANALNVSVWRLVKEAEQASKEDK